LVHAETEWRFDADRIGLMRAGGRIVGQRLRASDGGHPGGGEPALINFIGKGLSVLMKRGAFPQDAPTFGLGHFVFGSRRHGTLLRRYMRNT
jgi:hypothetical protein